MAVVVRVVSFWAKARPDGTRPDRTNIATNAVSTENDLFISTPSDNFFINAIGSRQGASVSLMDATHPVIVAEAAEFGKPENREFRKNGCNLLDAECELGSLTRALTRVQPQRRIRLPRARNPAETSCGAAIRFKPRARFCEPWAVISY